MAFILVYYFLLTEIRHLMELWHVCFYQTLHLRKLVSYSARIASLSSKELDDMAAAGHALLKSCVVLDNGITPSMWTSSQVAPVHTKMLIDDLGLGLGINTMQGREQKHQKIKRFTENATPQTKWKTAFTHEYIQQIYLRENGCDASKYIQPKRSYLPESKAGYCPCGLKLLPDGLCKLCSSSHFKTVIDMINKVN